MERNSHAPECSSECKIVDKMLQRTEARIVLLEKKKQEKDSENAVTEHTEYFNSVFYASEQEIKQKLLLACDIDKDLLSEYFDKIIKDLQKLQKLLSDSIMFMPAYEIKVAQEKLKLLSEEIHDVQNALLPKKKFAFRNKKKSPAVTDSLPPVKENGTLPVIEPNESTIEKLDSVDINMHNEDVDMKDVCLNLLNNCRVSIFGAPSTLFIRGLSNCQVFSGPVSTSVHIENCNNCTFAVACQQLRIHSSVMCTLYTHVKSRTVLEDSSSLQFAPYSWTYCGIDKDFVTSDLDRDQNNWNLIDDFNWLVAGVPSPNWSMLPMEKQHVAVT